MQDNKTSVSRGKVSYTVHLEWDLYDKVQKRINKLQKKHGVKIRGANYIRDLITQDLASAKTKN